MAEHQVFLSLAGLAFRLLDDAPAVPEWLDNRCKPFLLPQTDSAEASCTIAIRRNASLKPGSDQLIVEPAAEPGSFRFHGIDFIASRKRCGLPFEVEAMPEAGIAGLLRWVLAVALLEQGGLLLHAASCALDGAGVAFPGASGSGKTTLSRLVQPEALLFTDETTALRFEGSMPVIFATPFAGELGAVSGPASAPLEALWFLRHAQENQLRTLKPAEAAARLLGCVFMPVRQEPWLSAAMAAVESVIRSIGCEEFAFFPDAKVVEVLRGRFAHSVAAP